MSDLTLKQLIVETFADIINKFDVILGVDGNITQRGKTFDNIQLFHAFAINGKQRALIVDYESRIFQYKTNYKTKTGKRDIWFELKAPEDDAIVDICCGDSHSLLLTKSCKVHAWGNNYYRQLGINSDKDSEHPVCVSIPLKKDDSVIKICCGYYHNLALTNSGLLYAWGLNADKQCCDSKDSKLIVATQILEMYSLKSKLIDISCGSYHSLALDFDGNVYAFGKNDCGQLGIGHNQTYKSCHKIQITDKVQRIVSGSSHNLLLTIDGTIYAFGSNQFKQISQKDQLYYSKPTLVNSDFQDIAASLSFRISLGSLKNIAKLDNQCVAWGSDAKQTINYNAEKKCNQCSMQEFFIKNTFSTYKTVNFQTIDVVKDLAYKSLRKERIETCFWSAANNIMENYEFKKPTEDEKQRQILSGEEQKILSEKEKKNSEIKNLFTKLMLVYNQIPPNPSNFPHYAKLNIYHTLHSNMWKSYDFQKDRYATEFDNSEVLGKGGFGTVYKARYIGIDENKSGTNNDNNSTRFHELVAIKRVVINEYDVTNSLREIELVTNLNRDYVVSVKRFWFEFNQYFDENGKWIYRSDIERESQNNKLHADNSFILLNIESELCVTSLEKVLAKIEANMECADIFHLPLGYYIASELLLEILTAVDYLHRHRLTHRDLKPENILIKDFKDYDCIQRFVKIADFGLAVFQTKENQTYSKSNIQGTYDYMPPEVLIKSRVDSKGNSIDWRKIESNVSLHFSKNWDLFSLGQIFKEMFFIQNIRSEEMYKQKSVSFHEKLRNKYRNLFLETNLLKSEIPANFEQTLKSERPNCSELLKKERYKDFLIDKQECINLCEDEVISKFTQPFDSNLDENNFVEFFIHKKLS